MNRKLRLRVCDVMLMLALLLSVLIIAQAVWAMPTATPVQPQAEMNACGTISSSTTWTSDNVYVANGCSITIGAGVTLTVQAGTTVKFLGGEAALIVNGSLVAQGTAAQPITFSSLHDDAHGGTAAGSTGSPAAEDWYGIYFASGSSGQISHAFVGYGTAYASHSTLGWNDAHIFVDDASVTFDNLELAYGHRPGIYLTSSGENVQITDSYIHDHTNAASTSYPYALAIYQENLNMQPTYNNLTFSGNTRDEVTVDVGTAMVQSVTLGGTQFGFICSITSCALTVPGGLSLTVEPGTSLDFRSTYGIMVADGGSLIAEGTAAQPITFTSQLAAAGDIGQHWYGLWAKQGSTLRLDHCDISYAQNSNFGNGGLEINTGDAEVSNTHIHHNSGHGLYIYSRDGSSIHPILTNVEVTDNGSTGVALATSSGSTTGVTWDGGGSRRNGWAGLASDTWNSTVNPTLRNLTMADNGTSGGSDDQRAGLYLHAHNVNPVLENLTVTGNTGTGLHWYCDGSITARNLTATGNGFDELTLPGCDVSGGRQWDLAEVGIPVRVTGDIAVSSGGLLSLAPGTALHFDKNPYGSPIRLSVGDQAALYALGTATHPITFTAHTQTSGWWVGMEAKDRAELVLRHCDIGYGGSNYANLYVRFGLSPGVPEIDVQNCEIHHSAKKGVHIDLASIQPPTPHLFRYNHLHDNTNEAVTNWWAPLLDARDNYWGDPSGPYHPNQNPDGQGEEVGDNVLFYPWLDAPSAGGEAPGEMLVSTGAPSLVSPGQTADFAVQYLNGMTTTVENALLLLQLPQATEYVDSTGGGIYWPERHQVFWKLDDLTPGASDFVAVRVRFQWGLPVDYKDGSLTVLTADNFNAGQLETAAYNAYQPVTVTEEETISQAEFDALRAAHPALQALYEEATGQGYAYLEAGRTTFSDGTVVAGAVFRTTDRRSVRLLSLYEGQAMAATSKDGLYALHDTTGGMTVTLHTLERTYWGNWTAESGSVAGTQLASACSPSRCKVNCIGKKVTFKYVAYSLGKMFLSTIATGGSGGVASGAYHAIHVTKMIYDCNNECNDDPNSNCCTPGQVRWSPSGWIEFFGGSACIKEACNATTGNYGTPGTIYCAFGQRCVAGYGNQGGCKECTETLTGALYDPVAISPCVLATGTGVGECRDQGLLVAKDPNAIYGLEGDLLPGQTVTYTITYENEGAGRAYGVYVINELPEVFDDSTLAFVQGSGSYLPESREVIWLVGELGPKGDPDSEGIITYTVALTAGLPSGTVVSNQAVVYFPSVPEETPTNSWVNVVAPLVAIPQQLTTDYVTPLPITLSGRGIGGQPLTYEIVEPPHGGHLTGTLPDITYTPVENFAGEDAFTFRVSNGVTTSRPAQVYITVTSEGDTTPPQVIWSAPDAGATNVVAASTPVFTDTLGPIYSPVILAGISEALSVTTVTSATVTLTDEGGARVLASVNFDGGTNQIVISPRAALTAGQLYTFTVSVGVRDVAGNPLAQTYRASFCTSTTSESYAIYLPLVLRGD